jgi:hypothetical protein
MMVHRKLLLLLLYVQAIESLVVNRHLPQRRYSFVLLSENLENENDFSAEINGIPGADDDEQVTASFSMPPEINGYSMPSGQKKVGYSAFLNQRGNPSWLGKIVPRVKPGSNELDEDGYANLQRSKLSVFQQAMKFPVKMAKNVLSRGRRVEPGTLILVRHGESEWNKNKTFTGWADPDLTEQGRREVEHAARLLMEGGYKIDVVFSSRLKRAIRSVWILLQEFNEVYLPVFKSWRLNERMVSETICCFYGSMRMNSNVYLNIYKSINPPLVSFSMVL